jgi:hypothetical protein
VWFTVSAKIVSLKFSIIEAKPGKRITGGKLLLSEGEKVTT